MISNISLFSRVNPFLPLGYLLARQQFKQQQHNDLMSEFKNLAEADLFTSQKVCIIKPHVIHIHNHHHLSKGSISLIRFLLYSSSLSFIVEQNTVDFKPKNLGQLCFRQWHLLVASWRGKNQNHILDYTSKSAKITYIWQAFSQDTAEWPMHYAMYALQTQWYIQTSMNVPNNSVTQVVISQDICHGQKYHFCNILSWNSIYMQ